jgi:ion channel-forming bestrophin family protein
MEDYLALIFSDLCVSLKPPVGKEEEQRADLLEIRRKLMVFHGLLRQRISDSERMKSLSLLTRAERKMLKDQPDRPIAYLQLIHRTLKEWWYQDRLHWNPLVSAMENAHHLQQERNVMVSLKLSPLVFPYAQMILIFMLGYLSTLPFSLVSLSGAYTPIIAPWIVFAFWGLDEVALELEDPFGDDPNDFSMEDWEEDTDLILGGLHRAIDDTVPLRLLPSAEDVEG